MEGYVVRLVEDYPALLRRYLTAGAERLRAVPDGAVLVSTSQRSAAVPVLRDGVRSWLRVCPLDPTCMDEETWEGNLAANALSGIRRPRVLDRVTWTEDNPVPTRIAADVMTLVTSAPVSPGRLLTAPADLSDSWWADLRTFLARLSGQQPPVGAPSHHHTAERYTQLLAAIFGTRAPIEPGPAWSTQHQDLHWNNLTAPELWILDWEQWGTAVDGYGPATLLCTALGEPQTAQRVHATFADVLDSAAGRYAQLVVLAEMLTQATMYGELAELILPMHRLADQLLDRA